MQKFMIYSIAFNNRKINNHSPINIFSQFLIVLNVELFVVVGSKNDIFNKKVIFFFRSLMECLPTKKPEATR